MAVYKSSHPYPREGVDVGESDELQLIKDVTAEIVQQVAVACRVATLKDPPRVHGCKLQIAYHLKVWIAQLPIGQITIGLDQTE